ncbi:MAG: hypothetical protein H8E46_02200 [FCB group bacterium]|nr:hypothetical protein [FCB group bacterium]
MPPINIYKCDNCSIKLHEGWGGYLYVVDNNGNRIECLHPSEMSKIDSVLSKELTIPNNNFGSPFCRIESPKWWWSKNRKNKFKEQQAEQLRQEAEYYLLLQERIGFNSAMVCLHCKETFYLDIGVARESLLFLGFHFVSTRDADNMVCPKCGLMKVLPVNELCGEICPICEIGRIVAIFAGKA